MAHAERPNRDPARVRAAKRRRRLLINVALVALIVIVIGGLWAARRLRRPLVPGLMTASAERMDLTQTVSATGSVTAQTGAMVKIGSQITGTIKRLFADVGSQMKAGEVIAELDVPDLEAQVRQAEATLSLNRQRLAEQLAGVKLRETQAATAIDTARAAYISARANLTQVERSADLQRATAQAAVRQAQANDNNSQANLKRTRELLQKGYLAQADFDTAQATAEVPLGRSFRSCPTGHTRRRLPAGHHAPMHAVGHLRRGSREGHPGTVGGVAHGAEAPRAGVEAGHRDA